MLKLKFLEAIGNTMAMGGGDNRTLRFHRFLVEVRIMAMPKGTTISVFNVDLEEKKFV